MGILRPLNLNARQFDKWQKTSGKKTTHRNFFSCSKQSILDSTKPVLLLCPPPPLHLKLGLINLLMDLLLDASLQWRDVLLKNLAPFEKYTMEVRSKDASVQAPYPTLTSSSILCGSWSLNRTPLMKETKIQATCRLCSWGQGPMLTRFSIVFAAKLDKGIFRLTLKPRHDVTMANFRRSFREVMEIFRVNETPQHTSRRCMSLSLLPTWISH